MRLSTIQLVILVTFSICVTSTLAGRTSQNEEQNKKLCKELCEFCDCDGFYCGEECICERKKDDDGKKAAECIATVQSNARKMKADFEILIQGSKKNKFVQDAQEYEQNHHCSKDKADAREKRSTVVVYKPANALKDEVTKIHSKIANLEQAIVKRETETAIEQRREKRQSRPWFRLDEPLFKLGGGKYANTYDDEEDEDEEIVAAAPVFNSKRQAHKKQDLENVDAPRGLHNKQLAASPAKRFAKVNLPFFDPLPKCLFDVKFDVLTVEFKKAALLLKKAADDLLIHVKTALKARSDCLSSFVSKKTLLLKLKTIPGLKCFEDLFPKVKLCDLLDFKFLFPKLVGSAIVGDAAAAVGGAVATAGAVAAAPVAAVVKSTPI